MSGTTFRQATIGSLVEKVVRPVSVEPDAIYQQIGIRSHGKGLFDKPPVTGRQLGNKRVFWVEPHCFIVNIVFAWEQAVGQTSASDVGKIASHRFPMYRAKPGMVDIDFLTYLFRTEYGKELLGLASPGGAGRNKTLGQDEFLKTRILIPLIAEQSKIAQILCAWDQALDAREKLVANARDEKKALMQKLLTGRKRLSGFKGAWKKSRLGEVAEFKSGGTPSKENAAYWGGSFPWVSAKDLKNHYISNASLGLTELGQAQANIAPVDSILILVRGMTLLKDVPIGVVVRPLAFNQDIKALISKPSISPIFLSYLLVHHKNELRALVNTANHGTGRLDTSLLQGLPIHLPPIAEQRKIAEILSTWDRAIASQEKLAVGARIEKEALVHQLMTGKRRVKVEDVLHDTASSVLTATVPTPNPARDRPPA